jgi:hypothetical protein
VLLRADALKQPEREYGLALTVIALYKAGSSCIYSMRVLLSHVSQDSSSSTAILYSRKPNHHLGQSESKTKSITLPILEQIEQHVQYEIAAGKP